MRIRVAYVGRPRSWPLKEAAADYAHRLTHYSDFAQQELRTAEQVREKFPKARLVALDPSGKRMDSPAFARWLERHLSGTRELVFLVGGAEGLPESLRTGAELLSLSHLTLPHELARVVLLEQLYRAFCTLRGHPYPR